MTDCPDKFTTSSHIFTAIATSCFAWLLVAKPAITLSGSGKYSKYFLIILVHLILAIILPIVFLSSNLHLERDESTFVIIKMVALMAGALVREAIIIYFDSTTVKKGISYSRVLTFVIIGLLIANIAEAVYTQFKNLDLVLPGSSEVPNLNLINSVVGIILILILVVSLFSTNSIGYLNDGNVLRMVTNFGAMFIMAYTFWNLIFVIQIGGVPVFMFFCVTLLLPIIVSMLGVADWLQTRALTLLFFMLLTLGMGTGQSNILPMYNTIDEDPSKTLDKSDELTKTQDNYGVKIFLLVLVCIFTLLAVVDVGGLFFNGKLLISSKLNELSRCCI